MTRRSKLCSSPTAAWRLNKAITLVAFVFLNVVSLGLMLLVLWARLMRVGTLRVQGVVGRLALLVLRRGARICVGARRPTGLEVAALALTVRRVSLVIHECARHDFNLLERLRLVLEHGCGIERWPRQR